MEPSQYLFRKNNSTLPAVKSYSSGNVSFKLVLIILLANAPDRMWAQCIGSVTSINITRSIGCGNGWGSNASWDGPVGGTINDPGGSSSDFTVTWTTTGTFRLKRTFPSGCITQVVYSSYYTVAQPTSPTPAPASRCGSGSVTLSGTPGSGGATLQWYSALTGGTLLSGSTSYTTPSIATTTVYYITTYNSTTGCESSPRIAVTATVNPMPASPVTSNGARCSIGSVSLSGTPGANASTLRWYDAQTNGTLLATGTSYSTASINSSTSYYATSYNPTTTCESTPRVLVTATINPVPSDPQLYPAGRFATGTVILNGTPGANGTTLRWYDVQTNGTTQATSTSFTTPVLNNSTVFYSTSYNSTSGCESSPRISVLASVYPPPVITGSGNRIIMGALITLDAGAGYSSYQWFRNDVPIANETSQTFLTNIPGNYTVMVTKTDVPTPYITLPYTIYNQFDGQNLNYIVTNVFSAPWSDGTQTNLLSVDSRQQSIQYFDGLGRPIQNVTTQGSFNRADIIQPIAYDAFGKESTKYLPYAGGLDGWYKTNPLPSQATFYTNTSKVATDAAPFAVTVFEPSPLNRVLEQGAPGAAWQPGTNKTIKKAYEFNSTNEVILWSYTAPDATHPFGSINAGTASAPVYYAANQLFKNRTKDEHDNEVIEYVDKEGRTVLKKVQVSGTTYASTYYVYDDFGRLVYVLPPEGVNNSAQVTNFTATGSWTCPAGVYYVTVECWGGGGGGGAATSNNTGGGGGAGGAYARSIIPVTPGTVYTVTIGSGGTGGATTNGNPGGNSWFGTASTIFASGGLGGGVASGSNGTGATGSTGTSIGAYLFAGGSGANGASTYGGGGGGAAGSTINGLNASGSTGGSGGSGNPLTGNGASGPIAAAVGSTGSAYGGGGSGGLRNGITKGGGAGAAGYIRVSYFSYPQQTLDNWAFQYAYDARGRMILKKVPGADSVYMVYDKRDRLVLTQDGAQRAGTTKYWTFTKYDELNRPILTGIKDTTALLTQKQMQAVVDAHYNKVWAKYGEKLDLVNGTTHGYTNKSYPIATVGATADPNAYLTVTYYDDYTFRSSWVGSYGYLNEHLTETGAGITYSQPSSEFTRLLGQVTGRKTKVLDDVGGGGKVGGFTWLKSVSYYDDRYRVVQTLADNYKGGVDRVTNLYDFVGKVLRTKTTHQECDVTWKDFVGATQVGNKLLRSSGTAGAASMQMLGSNQDGWLEVTVSETNTNRYIGFNDSNPDALSTNIDYAFYLNSTTLKIYENNVLKYTATGNLVPGEVLRIARTGSTVNYYRNGQALPYSKTGALTTPLMVDVSISSANGTLMGVRTSFSTTIDSVIQHMKYDHAGRLIDTWHRYYGNGDVTGADILLAHNEYNELGQLVDKKLHSSVSTATDAKQSIDYRYNIRGWLTRINDANIETEYTESSNAGEARDLFGMNLGYNDDLGTGNTANLQYNGNINAIKWSYNQGLGNTKGNAYNYKYDALNRLVTATHLTTTNFGTYVAGEYDENIVGPSNTSGYDMNGNIKYLNRKGKGALLIDDLTYNYGTGTTASNKLLFVTDGTVNTTDKAKGFVDGNTSGNDYSYDVNGNMLTDKNKNITASIVYNILNLPEKVTRNNSTVSYIYDASGMKLGQLTSYVGGTKYAEYVGPWIYENDLKQHLQHAEGRITLADVTQKFTSDGDNVAVAVPTANVTVTTQTINGETYLKVTPTTGVTLTKLGVTQVGGSFPVTAGERYVFRVKGYSNSAKLVNLNVVGNGTDLVWAGSNLPTAATGEMWVENSFLVPAGVTTVTLGVLYSNATTSVAADYFYINAMELVQSIQKTANPEYQYNLKDHLGNVRLTFTTKQETTNETATYETANANTEQSQFVRYNTARLVNSVIFDKTNGGSTGYAERLNGSTDEKYGVGKSLSVMPGDVINAEVYAKYVDASTSNWTTAFNTLMGQIAGNTPGVVMDGSAYPGNTSSFPFPTPASQNTSGSTGNGPKAYLNWLVFDRNYNFILGKSGYYRIASHGIDPKENGQDVAHERLFSPAITIDQPGYVYIFLSNEEPTGSPVEVYFDEFKVTYTKSPVIQQDDYYPFGLTFNSYSRENSVAQDYKYNGKELQDELGINWLDYGARMYMPETGRFNRLDRASGLFVGISPYSYALNNPTSAIDVGGDYVIFVNGLTNIMGGRIMPSGEDYWGPVTISAFTRFFNGRERADKETTDFVNGEAVDEYGRTDRSWSSTTFDRYNSGRAWAIQNYNEIIRKYEAEKQTNPAATLNIVSHSQGAAFAEGIASVISEKSNGAYKVNSAVHLQPSSAFFIPTDANVDTRVAVYTFEDAVANKWGETMWGPDIEITEFRMKNRKIRHKIELKGKDYNDIYYKGGYGAWDAHGLNSKRSDILMNSLLVAYGAQAANRGSSNKGAGGDPRHAPPKRLPRYRTD